MGYMIWQNDYQEGFAVITSPDVDDAWELDEGVPRLATWPDDLECGMDDSNPTDIELSDNLYGTEFNLVSSRVKEIIEAEVEPGQVEFLPVKIRNHKGRIEKAPYYLLHPLECVECIDIDASGVQWNEITADLIATMDGLVLDEDKIPTDQKIFRLKYLGFVVLVRDDLIEKLEQAGLKGIEFLETEGYTGIE